MIIHPAQFIPHCEEEGCTLGTLEFDCPYCSKSNVNYDNYYDDDKVFRGEKVAIECHHCTNTVVLECDNILGVHVHQNHGEFPETKK